MRFQSSLGFTSSITRSSLLVVFGVLLFCLNIHLLQKIYLMRRKIPSSPVMQESEALHPSEALQKLHRDIDSFTYRAKSVAISLYTLTDTCLFCCTGRESRGDIASRLFALVGVVCSLRMLLSERRLQEVQDFKHYLDVCVTLLDRLDDNYVGKPDWAMNHSEACCSLHFFTPEEAIGAKNALQACYDSAAKAIVTFRLQNLHDPNAVSM